MATQRVGIRAFRDGLARYLEGSEPVAVTRHGETVAYVIPTRRRRVTADQLEALRTAANRLQAELEAAGVTEEDIAADLAEMDRDRKARAQDRAVHARA